MCGVTGVVHRDGSPVSAALVRRMTESVAHRGPDSDGFYVNGSVGLGHKRLAILDLTPAGHQPMAMPGRTHVLAYVGEVYNFAELRLELEAAGHQFHSTGDTEVVLHALAEWGLDAVARFNGMFAIALYDAGRNEVLLARDRHGVKGLYYAVLGDTVLFGSEIKAIIEHPAYRVGLDSEALVQYLTFQNFLTDATLFEDVKILPAGCTLRVPLDADRPLALDRYWDYHFEAPAEPMDRKECLEELDRLFRQAVSRQLVSDVPIGSYLSGGMDTGAITAVAAPQLGHMHSFTVGFDLSSASGMELSFDERAAAEEMSYLFATEHYEMVLKAGDMERVLPTLMWHLEEPRVGQSYPNYYAAKLAAKFGKVVLSGAGGDELFAGYPWRYYRAVVNDDFHHYIEKYFAFWQRLVSSADLELMVKPLGVDDPNGASMEAFRQVFAEPVGDLISPEDYVNHSLYFEANTFLHGLLVVEDKLSMAHSLETRVPFLDNDLVDFAMRIPVEYKLANLGEVVKLDENEPGAKTARYFGRTGDGKLILREAMARHVPEKTTSRVKQGFSGPDASWFRGDSIDYVRRTLLDADALLFDVVDRSTVHRLVEDHLEGRVNRRLLIWSLLSLEQWLAIFLGGLRPGRV